MLVSKNMNYYFNKQYFDDLKVECLKDKKETLKITIPNDVIMIKGKSTEIPGFIRRNKAISSFAFSLSDGSMRPWDIDGIQKFDLTTTYPGLLIGTGYAHDIKNEDAIKCGFCFDYVSGLPYLPSSSLKGMLRSYFPDRYGKDKEREKNKELYIKDLLKTILNKDNVNVNVEELKSNIFDYGDIFLDVFPSEDNNQSLLDLEYVTPHKKGPFSSPVPIRLVKVVPDVTFTFCFLLSDYTKNGEVVVSKEEKLMLFKEIIVDMGMGAKTNVGFGKLQEGKVLYKKPNHNFSHSNTYKHKVAR